MAADRRVYFRITYLNVDTHKKLAVTHPVIEAVVEGRLDEHTWQEIMVLDVTEAVRTTEIVTVPGQAVMLNLGVISFDVENTTESISQQEE